jgi:hypothetical protein
MGVKIEKYDTKGAWAAGARSAVWEVFPSGVAEEIERIDSWASI